MNSDTLIICSNDLAAQHVRLHLGCDAVGADGRPDFGKYKWRRIMVAATMIGSTEGDWIRKIARTNLHADGECVWL